MSCRRPQDLLTDDEFADLELGTDSVAEFLAHLGSVSPKRVLLRPALGEATADDVAHLRETTGRIAELVDGSLVEKATSTESALIATRLSALQANWICANGGMGRIRVAEFAVFSETLVRVPDVSFTHWNGVPELAPDLAVEVLSEGNTREEMERKLKEYFLSEVRLVWYIDPRTRSVRVYTSPDDVTELGEKDTLDGGDVLPGFSVPVAQLFDQLSAAPKPTKPPKANGGKKIKKRK
jgi:Uma2 family endonuclease